MNKLKENIKQLLASEDEENLYLAFQILQGLDNIEEFKEELIDTNLKKYLCLEYGFLEVLKEIKTLSIAQKEKQIPESIYTLTQLEELNLNFYNPHHRISTLSENLGNLINLKHLEFAGNMCSLDTLPQSIGKLQKLEFLGLYDTELKQLPKEVEKLESLTTFIATRFHNLDIEDTINKLLPLKLQHLGLWIGNLDILPQSLTKLQTLESLSLLANHFSFIPTAIYELKNLKKLDMSRNPIPEAVHEHIRKELKGVEVIF